MAADYKSKPRTTLYRDPVGSGKTSMDDMVGYNAVITQSIFSKILTTEIQSPMKARYGVSFVSTKSGLCL